jgi:hypothetical protein
MTSRGLHAGARAEAIEDVCVSRYDTHGKGVSQTINYLIEDRDQLDWLVAVGRNKNGEIFFYDTGGDIIEDLGTLEYIKERITRAHFGEEPE